MFKYFHKGSQYLNLFGGTSKKKHPVLKHVKTFLKEQAFIRHSYYLIESNEELGADINFLSKTLEWTVAAAGPKIDFVPVWV